MQSHEVNSALRIYINHIYIYSFVFPRLLAKLYNLQGKVQTVRLCP